MSTETAEKWLRSLGALCAGTMPIDEANARITAYAGLMAERYDPAVFCRNSLEAVAAQSKFWPSYGEVCDRLDAWWEANKPRQLAIPHPRKLTAQQAAHVACCHRRMDDGGDPALVMSVLHAHSGRAAVAEFLRDRPGLIPLAERRGWYGDDAPLTDDQRAVIRQGLHDLAVGLSPKREASRSGQAGKARPVERVPVRMDKLAVARAATPEVLALRPDLRAALDGVAQEGFAAE